MIAFQTGPGRSDADDAPGLTQGAGDTLQGRIYPQRHGLLPRPFGPFRNPWPVGAVDVSVTKPAAVTEEVAVNLTVVAVFDAANLAVAFPGADVATDRALVADAGGILQVPLSGVVIGMTLVGEHPSGADFGEVAGERAFQCAFGVSSEVDVVPGTKGAQIGATGVVIVKAHAPVAGNAAVHFVGDERPQVLVAASALVEPVAAAVMAGHYRHVLQVAMAALLAHRAVVGVIDHQPLHHTGPESPGFLVIDIDSGLVRRRGHTGHDQNALVVVLVLVLAHRALATGADTSHGRMPAEIGNIQAQ